MVVQLSHGRGWVATQAIANQVHAMDARLGRPVKINEAGRSNARQWDYYNNYYFGGNTYGIGRPAYPGTSKHETGLAIDFGDATWVRQNFGAFWSFTVAGEPWHGEWRGNNSMSGGGASADHDTKNRQAWLNTSRGENLDVDGVQGPATGEAYKRYQQFLRAYGYTGDIDGQWGPGTQAAHQRYYDQRQAPSNGGLTVDGDWGYQTSLKLQQVIGVTADGDFGPNSWKKLQSLLGVDSDGQPGVQTFTALQKVIGANADGQLGPETVRKLQEYLNRGGNFQGVTPAPAPVTDEKLTVDGEFGEKSIRALQKALSVTVDGQLGPQTIKALQSALGVNSDGVWGVETTTAVQVLVGATVDGQIGPETYKKLQEWLNAGKAFTKVTLPAIPSGGGGSSDKSPAKEIKPILPFALRGYDAPKGRDKRAVGSKITCFAEHHAASVGDQTAYFLNDQANTAIPTWYVNREGAIIEMTRPGLRPVTTAGANNYTVSVETQNISTGPEWKVSEASLESTAQIFAWLYSYNGKELDGIPVEIELSRKSFKGHKEFPNNNTICPGPFVMSRIDSIIERAKVIYAEKYAPREETPEVPTTQPENPASGNDKIEISRESAEKLYNELKVALKK